MAISPIRLVRRTLLFGKKGYYWQCDDHRLAVAELENRHQHGLSVIIHPSTKKSGSWQASFFEHGEPVRDLLAPSCGALLRELPNSRWRLRNVVRR